MVTSIRMPIGVTPKQKTKWLRSQLFGERPGFKQSNLLVAAKDLVVEASAENTS
jgi:hypothetical protein